VHGFLRGPTMHTDALGAGLALVADDPRQDLDRVRCPVLVLWGARDKQVPLEDGFEYARRLGAPLRVIADCGHLLIGERPDVCARAVLEFTQAR
jgi:pimeloyl-ACP methyl ester carboxylesterase